MPTSHDWTALPCDRLSDARAKYSGEVLGCGEHGTMIIFNGAIWHGSYSECHSRLAPVYSGLFVRRSARSGFDFRNRLRAADRSRMSPLARYLLALDDETQ